MQIKGVLSWASYDLANTIFSALFVTFFFPFYIKSFLGGNELQIGLVFGLSMLLVGIAVPVLGSISDKIRRRMPFIVFFTITCCIATFLIPFVGLLPALMLGFAANFCYHGALTMYNALLTRVSTSSTAGTVSGIGAAMGYIGTILSLIVAYPILKVLGWETQEGMKAMLITTAVLFLLLSLILFFSIKEKRSAAHQIEWQHVWNSVKGVRNSVYRLKNQKGLGAFLLAMFFYNDAINTVIIFLFLFGRDSIGLGVEKFFLIYAVFATAAAIGSFFAGKFSDRLSAKKILVSAGILWIVVIVMLLKLGNLANFVLVGSVGGIALGMVMASARPKLIELAPKANVAEYFGFFELADKFSGVLGPIIYGYLAVNYGYSFGLIALIVFFVIGLVFLYRVPDFKENNTPV